jgi:2-oxoglutarate ferredoxin oxidoreductase subunit alpha
MSEESIGHMYEKVTIPPKEKIEIIPRRKPNIPPKEYLPYVPDDDLVPPMAIAGEGYRFHITGLTHDERGYPIMTAEVQGKLVKRLVDKIEKNSLAIIQVEEDSIVGADIVVCSYGISARVATIAVQKARAIGLRVGMLRLITVWPFPLERIREIAKNVKAFVVPEINYGQISLEVERAAAGKAKTILVPHMGGAVHDPETILEAIKQAVK